MASRYDLACPVSRALVIVGPRWTALILRDLLLHGTRRFQDFQKGLAGIAPTVLSERLKQLEAEGVVERRFYSENPPRAEYALTEKGRDLGPIIAAMREWGEKYQTGE